MSTPVSRGMRVRRYDEDGELRLIVCPGYMGVHHWVEPLNWDEDFIAKEELHGKTFCRSCAEQDKTNKDFVDVLFHVVLEVCVVSESPELLSSYGVPAYADMLRMLAHWDVVVLDADYDEPHLVHAHWTNTETVVIRDVQLPPYEPKHAKR